MRRAADSLVTTRNSDTVQEMRSVCCCTYSRTCGVAFRRVTCVSLLLNGFAWEENNARENDVSKFMLRCYKKLSHICVVKSLIVGTGWKQPNAKSTSMFENADDIFFPQSRMLIR